MGNIFNSLNTGYSGLNANQAAVDVTSHNISNASNENYTRQRVQLVTNTPLHTTPGDLGTGAKVQTVVRIKDEYLFQRYESASSNLEYFASKQDYLQEVSNYFPDVDDVGLNTYLQDYFDSWTAFSNNPNDGALKIDLASKTQILTNALQETRENIVDLSKSMNEEIKIDIDEVNRLAKSISELNTQIQLVEANNISHANDLRDQRDNLEKQLNNLISPTITKDGIQSFGEIDTNIADYEENYTINIAGFPLVDNSTYHPLEIKANPDSKDGFYSVYFKFQDSSTQDITDNLQKGKVGALIEMRGNDYDENKEVTNGQFSSFIDELDALSASLIQSTNSIYAYSAQEKASSDIISEPVSLTADEQNLKLSSPLLRNTLASEVKNGTLTLSMYDKNGDYDKDVEVNIDPDRTLNQVVTDINDVLGADGEAYIENGSLKLRGTGDGAVVVKDDGSNLFGALNEVEYKSLSKLNNENLALPIEDGSFDVVVYDDAGEELSRRTIEANSQSKDPKYSTLAGIISQVNMPSVDDNSDNDSSNDVDDYYTADIVGGKFVLTPKDDTQTTFVGLDNDTSNFGGAVGINKFFDGSDASDISLSQKFVDNPSLINAYKEPSEGSNATSNEMIQLQYSELSFSTGSETINTTISGFYRYLTSDVANSTQKVNDEYDNAYTLFNTVQTEYNNTSAVDIDEEMVNLMKYQTGYQANAKVITTINAMLDTLLSIKQ
jgi:flagellar hook-associated protein 1 FlgK